MRAVIILAEGFEEIEAFTVIDILRRAGVEVTLASLSSSVVESSRKVRTMADKRLAEINGDDYDALILPGGPGYKNLANSQAVLDLIKDFDKKKKVVAAICAAPSVLAKAGVLETRIAAIYPGMENQVPKPRDAKVVVDGNIVTAKSPGAAMDFALKLAEILAGKAAARKVKEDLVLE